MGFSLAAYRARQRMVAENAREAQAPIVTPVVPAPQPDPIAAPAPPETRFRAPYPPSLNRLWRHFKGRTVLSAEGKAFKEQVAALALAAGVESPLLGWLEVELCLHPVEPQDAKKRRAKFGPDWHLAVRCQDIDNIAKGLLDAMQGVVYANDSQLLTLLIQRGLPVPDGGVTVKVREIEA